MKPGPVPSRECKNIVLTKYFRAKYIDTHCVCDLKFTSGGCCTATTFFW